MSGQPRVVKVFIALLVSMTAAAMLLLALGSNPPSAGTFCLSSYYRLEAVSQSISSDAAQMPGRWDRANIYYSRTGAGNVEQLASLAGLSFPADLDCHFVVCNGLGAADGCIQSTEKWRRQWSVSRGPGGSDLRRTIQVCVIGDGLANPPTINQRRRVQLLVEKLSKRFDISSDHISYPDNWL